MLTKRCPEERQKGRGEEEDSPCCSFNSIEFYSSVQLISLRSPLKSSLSFVAYCFTLRSATNECTYVRFSFTSVPAPLNRPKGEPDSRVRPRIETIGSLRIGENIRRAKGALRTQCEQTKLQNKFDVIESNRLAKRNKRNTNLIYLVYSYIHRKILVDDENSIIRLIISPRLSFPSNRRKHRNIDKTRNE